MDLSPFQLYEPETLTTGVVFSSPHSGRTYPETFRRRSRLTPRQLRASEDVMVDQLFATAPDFGAPLIAADAPRAWLDLNRGPGELDPALIKGIKVQGLNQRVAAGLGVVPRVVAEGAEIYRGKITLDEAELRIASLHKPYHQKLEALLSRALERFGAAILFDCHSMPTEALRAAPRVAGKCPEIVLGDRFGASAGRTLVARVQHAFEAEGFVVARNAPFAGGYITQRHGRPAKGIDAVQIEIDRGLYLDQQTLEPHDGFDDLAKRLSRVIADLVGLIRDEQPLAAE